MPLVNATRVQWKRLRNLTALLHVFQKRATSDLGTNAGIIWNEIESRDMGTLPAHVFPTEVLRP